MENITGKKVKINVGNFVGRTTSRKFKSFLDENSEKVFTAILDIENKYTCMYILKEDESTPKWLFFIEDLIIMEE